MANEKLREERLKQINPKYGDNGSNSKVEEADCSKNMVEEANCSQYMEVEANFDKLYYSN